MYPTELLFQHAIDELDLLLFFQLAAVFGNLLAAVAVGVELWYWRRLLRVPWPARRSTQSIVKETSPEYPLKGLMLKLKWQYFGHHLMQKN